jgi:hypothetical protein
MVAPAQTLIDCVQGAVPELYRAFACVKPRLGTPADPRALEQLYRRMGEVNFSHQVLEYHPERLAVIRMSGVRWNDLGEPRRVLTSLNMAGVRPLWVQSALPQFA